MGSPGFDNSFGIFRWGFVVLVDLVAVFLAVVKQSQIKTKQMIKIVATNIIASCWPDGMP